MLPRDVRAETNLARAPGLWESGPVQLTLPLDATGLGVAVRASGRLRLTPDLDVLAWVAERWLTTPPRDPQGVARFTLRDLGTDLYGRPPAGKERRLIRSSILRLFRVEVALTGYDTIERRAGANLCSLTRLFTEIATERDELNPADPFYRPGALEPTVTGALRGDTFRVQLPPWLREQLAAGNVTYLDWRTLRRLDGMAKRAWVYLEAERYKPTGDGLEAASIGLGRPALESLGAGGYSQSRQARAALTRAGARIVAADARYESVIVERRPGGFSLVARRLTGERLRVRRQARASLDAARHGS